MRENHFTSDFQRVKMANSRDPRMAKVYDKKSIYYHCVSLKKLLSQEEQALMQPLEDSLRQQDKLRPPYGECTIVMIRDIGLEIVQRLRN